MALRHTFCHLEGVGKSREARLWARGLRTWEDLDAALAEAEGLADLLGGEVAEGRRRSRRSGRPRARRTLDAWARGLASSREALAGQDLSWFLSRLPPSEHWRVLAEGFEDALYLDIETTGLSREHGHVTVVGALHRDEFHQWVWPQPWGPLRDFLARSELWVTFNGRRFDLPFLDAHVPGFRHPGAHVDLVDVKRGAGFKGGLKSLEVQLGLVREGDLDGLGGYEAVVLWHQAKAGDAEAYDRLLRYNRADVEMMPEVATRLLSRLAARAGVIPDPDLAAVPRDQVVQRTELAFHEAAARWTARRVHVDRLVRRLEEELREIPVVVGIDLRGNPARPTGWARLVGSKVTTSVVYKDADILAHTLAARPALVSIDAPLTLPRGCASVDEMEGAPAMREAERVLRARRVGVYPPLIPHMQGLTRRGIELAAKLRAEGVEVIESFPGAAQDLLGLPRKQTDLASLQRGLAGFGLAVGGRRSHDELDAVTSALVGMFYLLGDYEALGDPDEGQMIVPVWDTSAEVEWD